MLKVAGWIILEKLTTVFNKLQHDNTNFLKTTFRVFVEPSSIFFVNSALDFLKILEDFLSQIHFVTV